MMKLKIVCSALLCFAGATLHAENAPLFRMVSAKGWVFQEVERHENASTVEVTIQGVGSVAAKSMFSLYASCALMKERGKTAFTIQPLSKAPIRYIVRFVQGESIGNNMVDQPMAEGSPFTAEKCRVLESLLVP